ncbi:MAG: MoxR family ATPase [Myxococcota bacterium]|nr:MoxR family ATPase [Myxococcota bacterium]
MNDIASEPVEPEQTEDALVEDVRALEATRDAIMGEIRKRIIGQDDVIDLLLISLFAKGHGLFIGVPGLAKTLLISTMSEALSLSFNRIQFTPDLMPSDITGTDILEEDATTGKRSFTFIKGPIFTQILLADEINRTPPKTQAALLQAMQEGQVTAAGTTYALDPPFLVFATQNPIEQEGTYPLPEAQLDRFMFSIHVNYPDLDEEMEIVRRTTGAPESSLESVLTPEELLRFQDLVLRINVAPDVVRFAVELVASTRPDSPQAPDMIRTYVSWGAGPRASQCLVIGAKARAALHGRPHASTEDVAALAYAVLGHRVLMNFQAEAEGISARQAVEAALEAVGREG